MGQHPISGLRFLDQLLNKEHGVYKQGHRHRDRPVKIISIGAILWDVFEDREEIGGAPFNFAVNAARLGHEVLFISGVGEDARGHRALERMVQFGLSTRFVRRTAEAPTGTVEVKVDAAGQPRFKIIRPAAYDLVYLTQANLDEISAFRPDWIYFGTLEQLSHAVWEATQKLMTLHPDARRLYDINLRVDSYNRVLVRSLMRKTTILKINEQEAQMVQKLFDEKPGSIEGFCREYAGRFSWDGVCVTRGASGCALYLWGDYLEVPGCPVQVVDTVGAGDAFAAAFLHGLGQKWPLDRTGAFANRLGALVASRPGALPAWKPEEVEGG